MSEIDLGNQLEIQDKAYSLCKGKYVNYSLFIWIND